jgi:hypothetical protein
MLKGFSLYSFSFSFPPHKTHKHTHTHRGYSKWEATEAAADLAYNCPDNRQALGIHDAVALVVRCIEKVCFM